MSGSVEESQRLEIDEERKVCFIKGRRGSGRFIQVSVKRELTVKICEHRLTTDLIWKNYGVKKSLKAAISNYFGERLIFRTSPSKLLLKPTMQ